MKFPIKGGESEVSPDWIKEWIEVYWKDDVLLAIEKARLWCLDNPDRCKTQRGLRRFLGNWIRRDCRIKPQMRVRVEMDDEPKPDVKKEIRVDYLKQMKERLAR